MRKTYSILDQYGGVTQQFEGVDIMLKDGLVEIWDHNTKLKIGYVKAIHCLAPGTTICGTEEIDG
jgi:hypothetical protein